MRGGEGWWHGGSSGRDGETKVGKEGEIIGWVYSGMGVADDFGFDLTSEAFELGGSHVI